MRTCKFSFAYGDKAKDFLCYFESAIGSFMVIIVLSWFLSYLIFMPHEWEGYILAIWLTVVVLFSINITCSLFISQFFYTWRFVGSEKTSNALVTFQAVLLFLFAVYIFIDPVISEIVVIFNIPWLFISEIVLEVLFTRKVDRMLHTIGYDLDEMLEAKEMAISMLKSKAVLAAIVVPGLFFFLSGEILQMGIGWILITLGMVVGCVVVDKKVEFIDAISKVKKEDINLDAVEILQTSNFSISDQ